MKQNSIALNLVCGAALILGALGVLSSTLRIGGLVFSTVFDHSQMIPRHAKLVPERSEMSRISAARATDSHRGADQGTDAAPSDALAVRDASQSDAAWPHRSKNWRPWLLSESVLNFLVSLGLVASSIMAFKLKPLGRVFLIAFLLASVCEFAVEYTIGMRMNREMTASLEARGVTVPDSIFQLDSPLAIIGVALWVFAWSKLAYYAGGAVYLFLPSTQALFVPLSEEREEETTAGD